MKRKTKIDKNTYGIFDLERGVPTFAYELEKGLKMEDGDKLGKTIIFAKNSLHAQAIVERFHKLFLECGGDFIKQIDYSIKYCDSLIDEFSSKDKMP